MRNRTILSQYCELAQIIRPCFFLFNCGIYTWHVCTHTEKFSQPKQNHYVYFDYTIYPTIYIDSKGITIFNAGHVYFVKTITFYFLLANIVQNDNSQLHNLLNYRLIVTAMNRNLQFNNAHFAERGRERQKNTKYLFRFIYLFRGTLFNLNS